MSTSTAIVLAGALIGLGLYLGIRRDPLERPAPPAAEARVLPVVPPPTAPAPDPGRVRRHAEAALAYHRPGLRQACYLPAVAGEAPLPNIAFEFTFTFGPDGVQVMRGVVEMRDASRPAVTACVTAELPPLRIPPPGEIVQVVLPLSFP